MERHSAGATIVHTSPFGGLVTYQNDGALDREFIQKYVWPFYMKLLRICDHGDELREGLSLIRNEVNVDVARMLLGDFNWRTRSTGAFFAAVFNYTELEENIGRLMLKSEVCDAGPTYALTLAAFNSKNGIRFLNDYLDYYLHQTSLPFDQASVLAALIFLDDMNGSNEAQRHLEYVKQASDTRHSQRTVEQIRSGLLERPKADMQALSLIKAHLT